MDTEDALDRVTEVTVSTAKKKQLGQYEPAEAYTEYTAEVREGDDVEELRETLNELSWQDTEESIMERWEQHVRKEDE